MKIRQWIGRAGCGVLCLLAAACQTAPVVRPSPTPEPVATSAPVATPTHVLPPGGVLVSAPVAPAASATPSPTPAATATAAEPADRAPRRLAVPAATATPTRQPPPPTATRPANVRELHTPILMYHYLSTPPDNADAIRLDLSVPPDRFEQQVAYFAAQGFQTVKMQALYDAVSKGTPLPPRSVVFTFDDGYEDAYLNAMPILQKYHFIGTFFVITGFVGRPGYLTWGEIVEMAKAGMDIQSHTVTHIPMRGKTVEVLQREMGQSKRALEQMTGQPVNFFCYPSGQYDALAMTVLQESGYLAATTTRGGVWENEAQPFEWPRIRIHGHDQLSDMLKRLGYPQPVP